MLCHRLHHVWSLSLSLSQRRGKGPSCSNGLTATGRVFVLPSQRTDGHATNRATDYVSALGPRWWRACAWPRALWVLRAEPTSLGMCKRSRLDWSVYTRTICFSPTLALPSRSTMQVPQWPCNDLIIRVLYSIFIYLFILRSAIPTIRKFQNYPDLSMQQPPTRPPATYMNNHVNCGGLAFEGSPTPEYGGGGGDFGGANLQQEGPGVASASVGRSSPCCHSIGFVLLGRSP